jgi:hypothetical protein
MQPVTPDPSKPDGLYSFSSPITMCYAMHLRNLRKLSTQRSPFFLLPRFVSSFQNKVCQVCLRTQRGRPSCPRRRRGQDGHRELDLVTLRHFPVIWKEAEAEAEDGGRQVDLSFYNITNDRAFFRRSLLHAERRRRPVTTSPRLVATSRRRRVSSTPRLVIASPTSTSDEHVRRVARHTVGEP